ncbi:CopG family transcriptional regulator [bacterium]|nr:CopG family transcriptional regulator [bacterium]
MKSFKPLKQTKTKEKSVISIRIDTEMLSKVDQLAAKTDISRNEFLVQCIEYALKNLG